MSRQNTGEVCSHDRGDEGGGGRESLRASSPCTRRQKGAMRRASCRGTRSTRGPDIRPRGAREGPRRRRRPHQAARGHPRPGFPRRPGGGGDGRHPSLGLSMRSSAGSCACVSVRPPPPTPGNGLLLSKQTGMGECPVVRQSGRQMG